MKKFTLVLLVLAAMLLLSSCTSVSYVYTDSKHYTSGESAIDGRVEDIDISWLDGSVTVRYHKGSKVELSESAGRSLSDDTQLHWYLDGKTLRVKYAAAGIRMLPSLNKQLTVLLPEGLRLDDIKISVASAQVEADGIDADEIHIQSASGRIALRQHGSAETVKVDTASGGVAIAVAEADKLHLNTASGQVIVDARQVDEVKVNTASGEVMLQFAEMPDKVDVDAVSGNVTLLMPKAAGFTAEVDSLSGRVGGGLRVEKVDDDTYRYGNGKCRIDVDTVSSNVYFEENTNR